MEAYNTKHFLVSELFHVFILTHDFSCGLIYFILNNLLFENSKKNYKLLKMTCFKPNRAFLKKNQRVFDIPFLNIL